MGPGSIEPGSIAGAAAGIAGCIGAAGMGAAFCFLRGGATAGEFDWSAGRGSGCCCGRRRAGGPRLVLVADRVTLVICVISLCDLLVGTGGFASSG